MRALPLTAPPPGIGVDAWTTSRGDSIEVGDLWLLSWDGRGVGLGVVSACFDGFVLAWPVSPPDEPVAPPAVEVAETPLGVSLFPWPSRETGVGDALLHRNLGRLMSPESMASTMDAFEDGSPPPLPFAAEPDPALAPAAAAYSVELVDHWEGICLTQWPDPAAAEELDPQALSAVGLTPSRVAFLLGLEASAAVQVFRGERPVSAADAEVLAHATGVGPAELRPTQMREAVRRLSAPRRKTQVLAVAERLGLRESATRDLVASEYALAARSRADAETRLDAVFARLLGD